MQEATENLVKLVNDSGYLFQERLREEVQQTYKEHGWMVAAEEHRWCDDSGVEGFIDLVLSKGNWRMVIEVKRVREATWVFLVPKQANRFASRSRCLCANRSQGTPPQLGWSDVALWPASPEAKFCVIRGKGDRDQPMLERLGGILLRSTENLAEEEVRLGAASPYGGDQRLYFPMLVTNAQMYSCAYEPGSVDLKTGEFPEGDFQSVDFVRFRKGLSTKWQLPEDISDLRQSNRAKERNIFVVNGTKLGDLLRDWDI